jgi:hypothetical protein
MDYGSMISRKFQPLQRIHILLESIMQCIYFQKIGTFIHARRQGYFPCDISPDGLTARPTVKPEIRGGISCPFAGNCM